MAKESDGLDGEEWAFWKTHFPEILAWLPAEDVRRNTVTRLVCLQAVESRAFSLNREQAERWRAITSQWAFHKLPDEELELVVRIFLEIRNGRNIDYVFGETGRRLVIAAEKKHTVNDGYLIPFRAMVDDESSCGSMDDDD